MRGQILGEGIKEKRKCHSPHLAWGRPQTEHATLNLNPSKFFTILNFNGANVGGRTGYKADP